MAEKKSMQSVVLTIALAVLVPVTAWLVWQALVPVRSMETWPKAARAMGLTYTPMPGATTIHPGTISGVLDGHALTVEAIGQVRKTYEMTVTVRYKQPLGIGLRLESDPSLREELADRRTYLTFFDDDWAKRFQPRADDPQRAVRIVANGNVVGEINRLTKQGKGFRATDDEIVYFADSVEAKPDKLEDLLRAMVALADRMESLAR